MNSSSNITKKSKETCRMSWFLIELDDEKNGADLAPVYCIIHTVDIMEADSSSMYVNRIVKFKRNNLIEQGKIILASDDRLFVERHYEQLTLDTSTSAVERQLQQLIDDTSSNADDAPPPLAAISSKRYLVQYKRSANNIIHAIIEQKDICWPVGNLSNQREVLIRDGQIKRLATVLYADESEDKIKFEMQQLKATCFAATFDNDDKETDMSCNPWLLIQYSCSPANVVYAIINHSETVWEEENLYRDVVTYLTDGTTIYQSIIIRKSINRSDLDNELRNIKQFCQTAKFPLQGTEMEPSILKVNLETSYTKAGDSNEEENHDSPTLKKNLEQMEEQMQLEASMIADAFEAIDRTRQIMEKRFCILRNP